MLNKNGKEPNRDQQQKIKDMASNEILLTYNIRNKHCIKMFGYFAVDEGTCIVLELALGCDLDNLTTKFYNNKLFMKNNKCKANKDEICEEEKWANCMSDNVVRYFFMQILNALDYLKNLNLIHRDLNLSNVILTKNYIVKLGDYGFSKMIRPEETFKCVETWPEGEKVYTAPEIFQNKVLKNEEILKIDIYSLGICLLKMLTGNLILLEKFFREEEEKFKIEDLKPQDKEKFIQKLKEIIKPENLLENIEISRENVSEDLKKLIAGLTSFDEKNRWDLYKIKENNWLNENSKIIKSIIKG